MSHKEELTDAIEFYLLYKEPAVYKKTKRSEIKNWVDENYEIDESDQLKRKISKNESSFWF